MSFSRGYGVTNMVARATATAAELTDEEIVRGRRALCSKVRRYASTFVAFVGVWAGRTAFGRLKAAVGRQEERLEGSIVWVLPNGNYPA